MDDDRERKDEEDGLIFADRLEIDGHKPSERSVSSLARETNEDLIRLPAWSETSDTKKYGWFRLGMGQNNTQSRTQIKKERRFRVMKE